MLVDAFLMANDYLKLTSYIEGPSKFWKVCVNELREVFWRNPILISIYLEKLFSSAHLAISKWLVHIERFTKTWMWYHKGLWWGFQLDDTILKTIETAEQPELQEAREVVLRMRRRQLYQVHPSFLLENPVTKCVTTLCDAIWSRSHPEISFSSFHPSFIASAVAMQRHSFSCDLKIRRWVHHVGNENR